MVFLLPCESGEKISLGISSLLAMMVFLMAMTDNLPPTQRIPLAGTYYGTCIGILTANIMASIFVLNIQYKGVWGFPVPHWLRIIMFDFLARIMFVAVPPRIKGTQVSPKLTGSNINEAWGSTDANIKTPVSDQLRRPLTGRAVRDDGFISRSADRELEEIAARILGPANGNLHLLAEDDKTKGGHSQQVRELLEKIERHLASRREHECVDELKSALGEEWRLVAYVVDRLSGFIFLFVTVIFNVVILMSSPETQRYEYCRGPPGSCN